MKTQAGFNLLGVISPRLLIPSAQHWMFYSLKSTPAYYLEHTSRVNAPLPLFYIIVETESTWEGRDKTTRYNSKVLIIQTAALV